MEDASCERNIDVLAIGHICIDRIAYVEDFPKENESRHIIRYEEHPGGTVATAIAALSRLGMRTVYMSPIGTDNIGRNLVSSFEKEGILFKECDRVPGGVSAFTNVIVNPKKDTRTFLSWHGQYPPMEFVSSKRDIIRRAKILHLDNTQPDNAYRAAKIAKEHGTIVSLDGSSLSHDGNLERDWELAGMADILITSESYPSRLTGLQLEDALKKIALQLHPKVLIATLGAKGCIEYREGDFIHYPAFHVNVADTIGAGDAFHGGFLYAYLKGTWSEDPCRCIEIGSAVAALSCRCTGGRDGLPYFNELSAFLEDNTGNLFSY